MIAVDTNVIIRLITNDHKHQAKLATNLFNQNDIFLTKTVLLEAEWVLRHSYGLTSTEIISSLKKLLGLPNVMVENPSVILIAIEWFEEGMDFADALHVASARQSEAFATFDRKLTNKLASISSIKVNLLET